MTPAEISHVVRPSNCTVQTTGTALGGGVCGTEPSRPHLRLVRSCSFYHRLSLSRLALSMGPCRGRVCKGFLRGS